uniref:Uncharacterized protein n=1 Tax=Hyaloperonospora arabidopsidis (strain Emoy2) TaxID=559515 RepID=M4C1E1_HYAAE
MIFSSIDFSCRSVALPDNFSVARGKRVSKMKNGQRKKSCRSKLQGTWSNTGGERCATRADHRVENFPSKRN